VIGGLITATLLTLLILPVFYILFSSGKKISGMKFKLLKSSPVALLLLIFSFSGTIQAQPTREVNLKQAIQTALDSNLAVKSAAITVEVSRALRSASFDLPKTAIDGQYGQINSFSNDNSVTVSQSFAFPVVYANRYKLANANINSTEWAYKVSQLEIASQVKMVYYQYLYLLSQQKLLQYQDSLYSGFLRAAELRAAAGETNRLEMITARSQTLEIRNKLFRVNSDINVYGRKLAILLNIKGSVYPSEKELHRIDMVIDADSLAISSNPALNYIRQQAEVSRLENKLERSQMLPDLSIGYFSQSMRGVQEINGVPHTFGGSDRFTGIQAGISVPLWFVPYSSRSKAARLNYEKALVDAENYSKSLSGSYQALIDDYRKYSSSVDYYENQAVPEADMIIDQAVRSYKTGVLDYLDFVQTLTRAVEIRQNYLDALNDCNQTIISIEFVTGEIF
jgi:cobalt-zinc-cadmium resistance protein CzcA